MLLLQRSFCCNCTPLLTVFSLLLYFWLSVLSREMADQMFSSGRKVQWSVNVLATWASPLGDLSRGRKGQLEQPWTDSHWELPPLPYWEIIFRKLWDSDGDTCDMKIRQCFHSVGINVPTVFAFFATSTHETFIRCMFSISSALVETSVEYRADSWAWAVQTFIACRGAIYQLMCVPDIQLMSALAPTFVTNITFIFFKVILNPILDPTLRKSLWFQLFPCRMSALLKSTAWKQGDLELLVNQSFHWACEGMHWCYTFPDSWLGVVQSFNEDCRSNNVTWL